MPKTNIERKTSANMSILEGESIICFGEEDWWYLHPHSRNHIMKRLASKNKVMFINSISTRTPSIRSRDFFIRLRRKLRSYRKFVRRIQGGLIVVTPITIPLYKGALFQALNRWFLAFQIRLLMRLFRFSNPIVWIGIPTAWVVMGHLKEKMLIYHVADKEEALPGVDAKMIRKSEQHLKQGANLIVCSGRKLFEEEKAMYAEKAYFMPQAADFDHFASTTAIEHAVPRDIKHVKRPILGYFGGISSYSLDQELVYYVSNRRPEWSWLFIGLCDRNDLKVDKLPNVHFIGPRNYEDLPAYAAQFDVCVLPWRTDHNYIKYGSAIKVREYLATGKPVVIAPLYEYATFDGVLRIAHSFDDWIKHIEDALQSNNDEAQRRLRQASVMEDNWDVRTAQISAKIREVLHVRRNP